MSSEKGNEKIEKDDRKKIRLEIAETIYKEVLNANFHQSDIAARILTPVAFLTAAATFLFNFFLENNITVPFYS